MNFFAQKKKKVGMNRFVPLFIFPFGFAKLFIYFFVE